MRLKRVVEIEVDVERAVSCYLPANAESWTPLQFNKAIQYDAARVKKLSRVREEA